MWMEIISINQFISAVEFPDRFVSTGTTQTLTCAISGLSQNTPVTWIGPDNQDIPTTDTTEYVISQGVFTSGSKESTLEIKLTTLQSLQSPAVFGCKLRSALYPDHSPEVIKQMTLSLGDLGE